MLRIFFLYLIALLTGRNVVAQSSQPGSIWQLSLDEFTSKAEKTPATILGGCVSITEGAISISVMIMALEVTKSHEKNEARKQTIDSMNHVFKMIRDSLKILADNDNLIFKRFLDVYHLPSSTADQKRFKDSVKYEVLIEATESPLKSARTMLLALKLMKRSISYCSSSTKSDGSASATLLAGAIQAILQIADSDIAALKGKEKSKLLLQRNKYEENMVSIMGKIKNKVSKRNP